MNHTPPVVPEVPAAGAELVAFLPPGQAERRFRLLARLGGGKYSVVWRAAPLGEPEVAAPEVAVKVMAPGLSDDERVAFMDEVVRLNSLASYGRKSGLQHDHAQPLVPRVLGYSHQPVAFFAMTLARGKPLDVLLRENGSQPAMPELDVLRLGEQLCRAFRLLHEGLRRSYLDFQPGNVFWDEQDRHAMVVDWNLLSPEGQADVEADLQGVAQLLYRLAVGRAPQAGRLEDPEAWRALTSGLRELLGELLRPLPRRCADMAAVHQRVAQLLAWWGQEPGELMARMTELAPKPTPEAGEEQEASYRAALQVLDIAQARGVEPWLVDSMREQVLTYLEEAGGMVVAAAPRLLGEVVALRQELSAAPAPDPAHIPPQPPSPWTEAHRRLAEVEQILQTLQSAPSLVLTEEERTAFTATLDRLATLAQAGEGKSPDATPSASVREPQALLALPARRRQDEHPAPELHDQVDALRAQAGRLIESGLVNNFEPAINRIEEALAVSETLGDARLTSELRQVLNYYGEIRKQVSSCLRTFEEHKRAQQWEAAIAQLRHGVTIFRNISGQPLTGWEVPGEVEAEVEFLEHLGRFRYLYKQMERANHKAPLLQGAEQALQQMRVLRDKLRADSRSLLDEQEQRYAGHGMEPD